MPTYEYECKGCGKHFEYFQGMKEKRKTICEECGGKLERLLSAGVGLIFKGSGFYITDYKGGNAANSAEAKADSKAEADSKAGKESKPEAKAETKTKDSKGTESKPASTSTESGKKSD